MAREGGEQGDGAGAAGECAGRRGRGGGGRVGGVRDGAVGRGGGGAGGGGGGSGGEGEGRWGGGGRGRGGWGGNARAGIITRMRYLRVSLASRLFRRSEWKSCLGKGSCRDQSRRLACKKDSSVKHADRILLPRVDQRSTLCQFSEACVK